MRGGIRITPEKEEQIIAALEVTSHASRVAAALGVSFSTVWRRADREGIPLADGQKAKGYKRLSTDRREKILEIRRADPEATQEVVVREAGSRGHAGAVRVKDAAGAAQRGAGVPILPDVMINRRAPARSLRPAKSGAPGILEAARSGMARWKIRRDGSPGRTG